MTITDKVRDYWNKGSCGTDQTDAPKYSLAYFEEVEAFRYAHEPFIRGFAQFSQWKDKKVLEVGYGAGTDFLQFAKAGAELYGVDLTEEAAENVTRRLALYGVSARDIRVCNAEHLPFDSGTFDLVYSWGVIHHADDTEQCLREIARVAKPGGRVKIMIYNYNSLDAWICALRRGSLDRRKSLWNHMESVGTKAYTRAQAVAMAKRCGLEAVNFEFSQQRVRKGARFKAVRRLITALLPHQWGWYMMVDALRPVSRAAPS